MRRKLCLLVLTAGLTLGIAAPSQAAPTASPPSFDFGTFPISSPRYDLLTATVTPDATNRYFASLKMASGQPYFTPSSNCPYAEGGTCTVSVRVAIPITATGPLSGVIAIGFGNIPNVESQVDKEVLSIPVTANVTAAAAITPPPVVPPTTVPGSATPQPKPKKKACPKKGAKSSAAKGKACGKGKSKGKGKKGPGKGK